jgi:hypothetical protein
MFDGLAETIGEVRPEDLDPRFVPQFLLDKDADADAGR